MDRTAPKWSLSDLQGEDYRDLRYKNCELVGRDD